MDHAEQPKRRSPFREAARWLLAAAIVVFLVLRLAHDWPTVRETLRHMSYAWLAVACIPGLVYFIARIVAWQRALSSVGVQAPYWKVGKVWMNGEIIRYIPGNLWSVVGRVAMAPQLATTRVTVFSSMVLEMLALVMTAAGLSAAMLIGYPRFLFPGRGIVLVCGVLLCAIVSIRPVARGIVRLVYRIARKHDQVPQVAGLGRAFIWMTVAWMMFTLFQLATAWAVGPEPDAHHLVSIGGAFMASWLIGYLSFITPSGLGVREAVLAWLLAPFMGAADAILLAVMSRVIMIVVEVIALGIVNMVARRTA